MNEEKFWLILWAMVFTTLLTGFIILHTNTVNDRAHEVEMAKLGYCRVVIYNSAKESPTTLYTRCDK